MTPAQKFRKTWGVGPVAVMTLRCAVEEHVRMSYLSDLRECVAAGLVVFADDGRGAPILTEKGRRALAAEAP